MSETACRDCGPGYQVGDEGCRHGTINPPTVPRVATSLDDLRVGMRVFTIDSQCDDAWTITDERKLAAHGADIEAGFTVVILSEPPPEPYTVSREAVDRLAEAVYLTELADDYTVPDLLAALKTARALVDEVREADA